MEKILSGGAWFQNRWNSAGDTLEKEETIIGSISCHREECRRMVASCCVGVMMWYAHPLHSLYPVKPCGWVITFYPVRSVLNLSDTSPTAFFLSPCPFRLPVLGEWKRGCILLMRYAVALIQQPELIYSLICATVGPMLSLRGGGGFVSEMPVVLNPERCCVGFPWVSASGQTLVMRNVLSHADREIRQIFCNRFRKTLSLWATADNVFHVLRVYVLD